MTDQSVGGKEPIITIPKLAAVATIIGVVIAALMAVQNYFQFSLEVGRTNYRLSVIDDVLTLEARNGAPIPDRLVVTPVFEVPKNNVLVNQDGTAAEPYVDLLPSPQSDVIEINIPGVVEAACSELKNREKCDTYPVTHLKTELFFKKSFYPSVSKTDRVSVPH